MITVALTEAEASAIVTLCNQTPGMENARILLPLYDKVRQAAAATAAAPRLPDADNGHFTPDGGS